MNTILFVNFTGIPRQQLILETDLFTSNYLSKVRYRNGAAYKFQNEKWYHLTYDDDLEYKWELI